MDIGMIVTFAGLFVAGLAGVLGVWMERDPEAPPKWAFVFSFLIVIATGVEMSHSVVQAAEDGVTEEKMAVVLEALAEMAESGKNPALANLVNTEMAAASRANPGVMKKMEKRAKAKGKDPKAIRRKAKEGGRKSAGLPAKKPKSKAGAKAGGKAGGKAPGKAGGKAPGKAGGKADGKAGKADGKAGKADGKAGKADGKAGKSDGKADNKAGKSDSKSGGKSDSKSGGKSDGKADSKSGGKSDSKSKGKGN
ncbi:MAG: hypothetical protein JNM72_20755 [Deltaproteobacteria bacterium]|nr:hypothetical protein [Deltaproteobacteria bacterium]